jgi:hypothetical protein
MFQNWLERVFYILENRHGEIDRAEYDMVDFRSMYDAGAICTDEAANIADVIKDWTLKTGKPGASTPS